MSVLQFQKPQCCRECGSLECPPLRCRFADPVPQAAAAPACPYFKGRTCDCGQHGVCLEVA